MAMAGLVGEYGEGMGNLVLETVEHLLEVLRRRCGYPVGGNGCQDGIESRRTPPSQAANRVSAQPADREAEVSRRYSIPRNRDSNWAWPA